MITEYDKSRLVVKYEQYCQKYGIPADLFDIEAEIDGSLTYWENWGIIEDKLSVLKNNSVVLQNKPVEQKKVSSVQRPLIFNLDQTDSIAIVGDRNSGKTNLAFQLMNNYRGVKDVYLYGYPKSFAGFKSINTWQDMLKLTDSIIFIDEIQRYVRFYDRKANSELMELLSFLAHQNNTLIFTTQLSQFITKGVEASIQTWCIKQLDISSLKNGCKIKRILKETADVRITDKGMNLNKDEFIIYDVLQETGFNGVYTFVDQNVKKDWKNRENNTEKKAENFCDKNNFGGLNGKMGL